MTRARDLADGKHLTNVDSNTLVVDQTNDRVGIGLASPEQLLHVRNASGNSVAVLGQFGTGTKATLTAAANQVDLKADNGTNDFITCTTGSSERLRIAGDGKVGINTTAANLQTSINFDTSAVAGLGLHDTNSGNLGGMLQFYSGSGQGTLRANIMNANNAGVHMAVGTGGSVVFTQNSYVAANAMDDYEIGSIASSGLSDASGAGLSFTFNSGNYVKAGDMVAFELDFSFPINSNGSTAEVTCLPFTQVGNFGAGAIGYHTRGGFTSSYILGATQKVRFASSAGSNFTNANLSNVRFIVTYIYRSS